MARKLILIVPFVPLKVFSFKVNSAPVVVFGVIQNPDPKTILYLRRMTLFSKTIFEYNVLHPSCLLLQCGTV